MPLNQMHIRTAESEQNNQAPGVTSKLSQKASPLGGAFGMMRSSGHRPHQGWDLYAPVGSPVYAVSSGVVEFAEAHGDYGVQVCVRLGLRCGSDVDRLAAKSHAKYLYAFYAHLSSVLVRAGQTVQEGQLIAFSGNSGNASHTPPHLHFEIRTEARPGKGLRGRIDPGNVLGFQHYQCAV